MRDLVGDDGPGDVAEDLGFSFQRYDVEQDVTLWWLTSDLLPLHGCDDNKIFRHISPCSLVHPNQLQPRCEHVSVTPGKRLASCRDSDTLRACVLCNQCPPSDTFSRARARTRPATTWMENRANPYPSPIRHAATDVFVACLEGRLGLIQGP